MKKLCSVIFVLFAVTILKASEPKKDCGPDCCGCKLVVSEPKAYEGANCPVGLVATGVKSVRPPMINCVSLKVQCECKEGKEDGNIEY